MHAVSADAPAKGAIARDEEQYPARPADRQIAPRDRLAAGRVIVAKDDSAASGQGAQDRLGVFYATPVGQESKAERRRCDAGAFERQRGGC